MSNKKKALLLFLFIIFDMFLLIGFLVIRDATNLNLLKKEISSLYLLDPTVDNYNTKLRTTGDYRVVEKSIKEYLNEYSTCMKNILDVVQDKKIKNILSYSNYEKDGKKFKKSLKYIKNQKDKFNENYDKLNKLLDTDNIKNNILDVELDPYYVSLYEKLILSDEMIKEFEESKDILDKSYNSFSNVLNTSEDVLNFLVLYSDSWELEDGEIKFANNDLYTNYVNLVNKVKVN